MIANEYGDATVKDGRAKFEVRAEEIKFLVFGGGMMIKEVYFLETRIDQVTNKTWCDEIKGTINIDHIETAKEHEGDIGIFENDGPYLRVVTKSGKQHFIKGKLSELDTATG